MTKPNDQWQHFLDEEFYNIPEDITKEFYEKTTLDLILAIDECTEPEISRDSDKTYYYRVIKKDQWDRYYNLLYALCYRLELIRNIDALMIMKKLIQDQNDQIAELKAKFEVHRHDLNKAYSSGPM